jgi:hypothetical protein
LGDEMTFRSSPRSIVYLQDRAEKGTAAYGAKSRDRPESDSAEKAAPIEYGQERGRAVCGERGVPRPETHDGGLRNRRVFAEDAQFEITEGSFRLFLA